MEKSFTAYGLSQEICDALTVLKYKEPTEIQKEVLPCILEGKDVVARSQTGSGKTAAFGIPLCEFADWNENAPESLVLEPTRELSVQVQEELFNIGRKKRLKVPAVFGGFPIEKQLLTLKQKSHIVVGTPGRVMDHVRRESLDLSKIKHLVIDEADLMLDMGFLDEVETIIDKMGENVQIMLFSATIEEGLEGIINRHMKSPTTVEIESDTNTVSTVTQLLYKTDSEEKYENFKKLFVHYNPKKAIIFCGTKLMVDVLCRKLGKDHIKCGMIHGDIDQKDRLRTIEGIKDGRIRYLIATDVAARGIDIENLDYVFNYDFPTGRETYVHRIGRTARNGKTGYAISLLTPEEEKMRQLVERYINMSIPDGDVADIAEDNPEFWKRQSEKTKRIPKKGADFNKTITKISIGGGKKSKIRAGDIVATICGIDGITVDDIGIIDVRESLTYVEILNSRGKQVLDGLQEKTIKGKKRKVRITRADS